MPTVIALVHGKPVTRQASVVEGVRLERFHRSAFMETAEAARPLDEEAVRSTEVCALSTLRQHQRGGGDDMHILLGGEQRSLRVVAARDIKKGELLIAPIVGKHTLQITAQCQQGWAPQVVVRRGNECMTMYLSATASFPAIRQATLARSEDEWAAASAVADGGAHFGDHDWKATSFPWPFWAIRRSETAERKHCSFKDITINTVHTSSADETALNVYEVVIPMMVNSCDISKGTGSIAHWPSRTAAAPKRKELKLTVSTWVHQATKKTNLDAPRWRPSPR